MRINLRSQSYTMYVIQEAAPCSAGSHSNDFNRLHCQFKTTTSVFTLNSKPSLKIKRTQIYGGMKTKPQTKSPSTDSRVHAIQLLILLITGGRLCLIFNYALCKYPQRLMQ